MGSLDTEYMRSPLDIPSKLQVSLLEQRASGCRAVPAIHLNTTKHRQIPPPAEQINFRVKLLRTLRQGWMNVETEGQFLETVNIIDTDGCGLFGGLIDTSIFEEFVTHYDNLLTKWGNKSFMHSYVNIADHIDFLRGGNYIDAFAHPLLIALISYLMGGPIRIMDLRGKDTNPISINAQDNMLHVDNTPFKEEYKILLNWERSKVRGPSGQNFTFLPWTHKGNRDILINEIGEPWSTERDSLFSSHEAIDGLLEFQKQTKGVSCVVEATHPEQPLAVVFPAGSLVHHRFRTEEGNARSCIIAAFHLTSKHPGQLLNLPLPSGQKKTLIEYLVSYQDENSESEFLDILLNESLRIEEKIQEIFRPDHQSIRLDLEPLYLRGDRLSQWRRTVVEAPNPLEIKLSRNLRLFGTGFGDLEALTAKLAEVMMYDKHGLLQLILYKDGREEIRKPARKRVGEMKVEVCVTRLKPWIRHLHSATFSAVDLIEPKTLRVMCDALAGLASNVVSDLNSSMETKVLRLKMQSLSRLMMDVGEAITRCEGVETFVATNLFIFWTAEEIYWHLGESDQLIFNSFLVMFLRNYVAAVLLVESTSGL